MTDLIAGIIVFMGWMAGVTMLALLVMFVQDVLQKDHAVRRNFPIIGRLRYFLEKQGEYFRQYFFAHDREELPFNRATRAWVYRTSKNLGGMIGFGSTSDLRQPGTLIFVNAPYPTLGEERQPAPPLVIGPHCEHPLHRTLHRQCFRYELRRDLSAGGARSFAWRAGVRHLDEYRRRWLVALSLGWRR